MIVLKAHLKVIYALAFSPDGRHLASTSADETVRLWALDSTTPVSEWPGSRFESPLAFSADGRHLARGGRGIRVWAIDEPTRTVVDDKEFCESIAFSPDGKVVVVNGGDAGVPMGRAIGKSLPAGWGGTRNSTALSQFPTGGVAYSPDGKLVATVFGVSGKRGYDSMVYLWDSGTGALKGELRYEFTSGHPQVITFSPDGRFLAGAYGPAIVVWDVAARKQVAVHKPGKKHFKDLAFTPDGRRLVAVNNDKSVRLLDTATWAEVGGYEWKAGKLGAVAVSPDGMRMATGGDTGKVVIWDVDD